jgi:hypothetical protein
MTGHPRGFQDDDGPWWASPGVMRDDDAATISGPWTGSLVEPTQRAPSLEALGPTRRSTQRRTLPFGIERHTVSARIRRAGREVVLLVANITVIGAADGHASRKRRSVPERCCRICRRRGPDRAIGASTTCRIRARYDDDVLWRGWPRRRMTGTIAVNSRMRRASPSGARRVAQPAADSLHRHVVRQWQASTSAPSAAAGSRGRAQPPGLIRTESRRLR